MKLLPSGMSRPRPWENADAVPNQSDRGPRNRRSNDTPEGRDKEVVWEKNKVSKARAETKVQNKTVSMLTDGTKTRKLSKSFEDANKYN